MLTKHGCRKSKWCVHCIREDPQWEAARSKRAGKSATDGKDVVTIDGLEGRLHPNEALVIKRETGRLQPRLCASIGAPHALVALNDRSVAQLHLPRPHTHSALSQYQPDAARPSDSPKQFLNLNCRPPSIM